MSLQSKCIEAAIFRLLWPLKLKGHSKGEMQHSIHTACGGSFESSGHSSDPQVTLDMIFILILPLPNVSQFPFSENFDPIMKSSETLKGLDQTFIWQLLLCSKIRVF